MDTVAFHWTPTLELRVSVNGRRLEELFADIEGPLLAAEGRHSDLAGSYGPLPYYSFRTGTDLLQHFLGSGESHLLSGPHDRTVLLACECGEKGCWPLMARVTVDETTVTWSDFGPNLDYQGLTLTFDRRQYVAALEALRPRTSP